MRTETKPPSVAADEAPMGDDVPRGRAVPRRTHAPILVLVGLVVAATLLYGGAAQLVSTPRVHPDEHIYGLAGASLAEGHGLTVRGDEYHFGPLYPTLLAGILTAVPDRETAYHLYKLANALLFALAAVPIFLVARRLLTPWWSLGVAALSIAIPSSMYVSVVMTESTAYLVYSVALYAIVLALERPSPGRQVASLAACGVAYATRAQLAVLAGAYLVGLVAAWALPRERAPWRDFVRRIWPSLAIAALALAALFLRPLVTGSSALEAVGAYEVLFRGYNPLDLVKWTAYHLADLELYLAVVPIAVSPIVLVQLWRRGRAGAPRDGAFLVAFVTVNAAMLFVTAAFSSTEYGFDRLHDRNVFYLAPLWLAVLALWLAGGLPRPLVATAVGAAVALVLPAVLPFRYIAEDVGVDVVPSALWARLQESLAGEVVTARKLLVLALVALVVAVVALPRRFGWAFPAVILATFAATAALAWDRMIDGTENAVFERPGFENRSWVDDLVPPDAEVTKLYLDDDRCPGSALSRHSLYLTEFFNSAVRRAAYIGASIHDGLPIERVDVGTGGVLRYESGAPLTAEYVYTQSGIELEGERLGSGTAAELVLWRVGGHVIVRGARANEDIRTSTCPDG
jgi:hypothetical protein